MEELFNKIYKSNDDIKIIFDEIYKNKEHPKIKIQTILTKKRNTLNEKEYKLFFVIDNEYNNNYFKEDLIK